jgi:hypothetical protein
MRKSLNLLTVIAVGAMGIALLPSCQSRNPNFAGQANYYGDYGAPAVAENPAETTPVGSDGDWPRVSVVGTTTNTVYQPQVDSWDGYTLTARNAVAVQSPGQPQPVYGVITVRATTLVNKTERTVDIENAQILSASFPSAPDRTQDYLAALRESFPTEFRNISLDRIEASLAATQQQKATAAQPLDNAPPEIIFAERPSILVYIDGQPAFRPVAGTDLSRVVNTRVLLLKDNHTGQLYLHVLNGYLSAPNLNGPWEVAGPPPGATVAEDAARSSRDVDLLEGEPDTNTQAPAQLTAATAPQVYVRTGPAELITFNGPPQFAPIPNTQLLYVTNTTGNVFKLLADQQTYVLISGRWYRGSSFNGPWEFVPPSQLPGDFAQIPDSSPKENVKASIAGTPQAQEALIENNIPQSTKVARTTQIQPPQFDGAPQISPVSGTPLSYVINSDTPIIRIGDNSWFACQNAVWFTAPTVNGPWTVADSVPEVIYSIPPSSALYYVTFVHIYNATPEYVYEGYTPGYLGAVATPDNTVVYGTGYDYQPWIGDVWYGEPVTWGLGCDWAWTPWFGWDFAFGFGWDWGYLGWWHPPGPWWGPYRQWAHRAWDRMPAWGPGGWAHTGVNLYDHNLARAGAYRTFGANRWHGVYGRAYNSRTGEITAGHRAQVRNVFNSPYRSGMPAGRLRVPNDAFATRDGGVFLRDGRTSGGWRAATPSFSRPVPRSTYSFLGRENDARAMGDRRFNNFRSTYPSGGFHAERSFGGRAFGGARSPGGFSSGGGRGGNRR